MTPQKVQNTDTHDDDDDDDDDEEEEEGFGRAVGVGVEAAPLARHGDPSCADAPFKVAERCVKALLKKIANGGVIDPALQPLAFTLMAVDCGSRSAILTGEVMGKSM